MSGSQGQSSSNLGEKKAPAASSCCGEHQQTVEIHTRKDEEGPRTPPIRRRTGHPFFVRGLEVVLVEKESDRPRCSLNCRRYHNGKFFEEGQANINLGFEASTCVYLLPLWTNDKDSAKVTGFKIEVTDVEDPDRANLHEGVPGLYVYLVPTFDPNMNDRITGVWLKRSKKDDPEELPSGTAKHTEDINHGKGRGGLYLGWVTAT